MKSAKILLLIFLVSISNIRCFQEGDVRLVPVSDFTVKRTEFGGRLELFSSRNEWTAFCVASTFDLYEADIACKQLGFRYVNRTGTTEETTNYAFGRLQCSSRNTRLGDCSKTLSSSTSCFSNKAITLECTNTSSPVRLRSESGRTTDLSAGRLEILIDDKWGTVCNDHFRFVNAHVACRQLGFLRANSMIGVQLLRYPRAESSTPIWLDDLDCTSSQEGSDLRLCKHRGVGVQNCNHDEDIFMSCIGPNLVRLRDDSKFKLRGFETSGRLEIYRDGDWGSVCYEPSFTLAAAQIACRQMGLEEVRFYGSAQSLGYTSLFSGFDPEVILRGVACNHSEVDSLTSILDCDHSGLGLFTANCSDSVGISCAPSYIPPTYLLPTRGTDDNSSEVGTTRGFPGNFGSVAYSTGTIITIIFMAILAGLLMWNSKKRRSSQSRCRVSNRNVVSSVPSLVAVSRGNPQPSAERPYPTMPSGAGDHGTTSFDLQEGDMSTVPYPEPSYKESELQEAPPPSYEAATQYPTVMTGN